MKQHDDPDHLAVYECLRLNPRATYTSVAQSLGWTMADGKPYHMRAKRVIDRLLKYGNIKRELYAAGRGRFGKLYQYKLIRAPIAANIPAEPAPEPASRVGILVKERRLRTQRDAMLLIRHIVNLATGLPGDAL